IARSERDRGLEIAEEASSTLYFAEMNQASRAIYEPGGVGEIRRILRRWIPQDDEIDRRGWEWYYLWSFSTQERAALYKHRSSINGLDLSPDGLRFASASSNDPSVWIHTLNGERKNSIGSAIQLNELGGQVVSWAPDNDRLAIGSLDGVITIWSVTQKKQIASFSQHDQTLPIQSIKWRPDGEAIASCSSAGRVLYWDPETGEVLNELQGAAPATSLSFSPDGTRIVVGGERRADVFNTLNGERLWTFESEESPTKCVSWSPDGRKILWSGSASPIIIFNADTGAEIIRLNEDVSDSVWTAAWADDSQRIAAAHEDRKLHLWSTETGTKFQTFTGHTGQIRSVAWTPDGLQIVSAALDASIRVWDLESRFQPERKTEIGKRVDQVTWDRDGKWLASVQSDGSISLWNVESKLIEIETAFPLEGRTLDQLDNGIELAWSPVDDRLAAIGTGNDIYIWQTNEKNSFEILGSIGSQPSSICWHPKGRWLAVSDISGDYTIWDTSTQQIVSQIKTNASVTQMAWSPDGEYFAYATQVKESKAIAVDEFNDPEGKITLTRQTLLRGSASPITKLSWNPEGSEIAVASRDRNIRIYSVDSGSEIGDPIYHTGFLTAIDWNFDAVYPRIVAATNAGTLLIWDTHSHRCASVLEADDLAVRSAQWHPTEPVFAAASGSTIQLWNASHGYEEFFATEADTP
ncbi:MAG: hypothetical protein AAF664_06270, partial [Planctomycetota bacterium]